MAEEKNKQGLLAKLRRKRTKSNEDGARKKALEDLFYDFNRSRVQIYKMNLFRGIFFGAGSVIGGTVVIALVVWLLSTLGTVIPPLDSFFNGVSETIETGT
jgi:hypothetical protein